MASFGVPLGPLAQPVDGPWASSVSALAAAAGISIIAGMFTPAGSRVRNTLLVTGPGVHASYDKVHLYDAFGFAESRTVAPGESLVVVPFGAIAVGLTLCYDVRFPEMFRALADRGANVIVVPASWGGGPGKREQWELLVRARALDCTSWVVACAQADPAASGISVAPGSPTGIGYSTVVDPYGRVVAQLGAAPDLLIVDVDTDVVDAARKDIPVLLNRRPGAYR
jgi:predicted amidohydrolase